MSVTLDVEGNDILVMRVKGILRKNEFDSVINAQAEKWGEKNNVRVLVIVEQFEGFEKNEAWADISFFIEHGDQIEKIAIVADPGWKDDLMVFAAAGLRRAPVQFFTADGPAVREWLASPTG